MVARPLLLVALFVVTLIGCGDPDPGIRSQSEDAAAPESSAFGASGTSVPPGGVSSAATEPSGRDDVAAMVPLARCADVARITTDVVSDTAQGNIDPIFQGVLLTYAAEHADMFGGLWIDRDSFGTVVLAFTDDPATHREAIAQRRPTPDDIKAVEPAPEITDDRPIGEWDVAFDVVQVAHTEADLVDAIAPVIEAARSVTGAPVSGGLDVLRNKVNVDVPTPITRDELVAITDAIADVDGVSVDMVCWSGQFVDEAPEPIEPGTPLEAIWLPGGDGAYPVDTPVTCAGLAFEVGDLENPTPVTDIDPGLRSVLDDWLATAEGQYWPQDGWVLLHATDERASFVHISDDQVSAIDAEMGANGWIWTGASGGGNCDVLLSLPAGVGEVEWVLDPDAPAPDPSSTEIQVLATERGCAGGQEMGDRLLGPQVVETDHAVLIAFGVIPRPGAQECPGNPSTSVVVELDAPLGEREIRDGLVIGPITSLIGS